MQANEFTQGFTELMNAYNNGRENWVTRFGNDKGFNKWFTCKVDHNETKADELLTAKALGR